MHNGSTKNRFIIKRRLIKVIVTRPTEYYYPDKLIPDVMVRMPTHSGFARGSVGVVQHNDSCMMHEARTYLIYDTVNGKRNFTYVSLCKHCEFDKAGEKTMGIRIGECLATMCNSKYIVMTTAKYVRQFIYHALYDHTRRESMFCRACMSRVTAKYACRWCYNYASKYVSEHLQQYYLLRLISHEQLCIDTVEYIYQLYERMISST